MNTHLLASDWKSFLHAGWFAKYPPNLDFVSAEFSGSAVLLGAFSAIEFETKQATRSKINFTMVPEFHKIIKKSFSWQFFLIKFLWLRVLTNVDYSTESSWFPVLIRKVDWHRFFYYNISSLGLALNRCKCTPWLPMDIWIFSCKKICFVRNWVVLTFVLMMSGCGFCGY